MNEADWKEMNSLYVWCWAACDCTALLSQWIWTVCLNWRLDSYICATWIIIMEMKKVWVDTCNRTIAYAQHKSSLSKKADRDLYVITAAQIYAPGFGLVGVIEMHLIYGAVRPATTPLDEAHGNERAAIALWKNCDARAGLFMIKNCVSCLSLGCLHLCCMPWAT